MVDPILKEYHIPMVDPIPVVDPIPKEYHIPMVDPIPKKCPILIVDPTPMVDPILIPMCIEPLPSTPVYRGHFLLFGLVLVSIS